MALSLMRKPILIPEQNIPKGFQERVVYDRILTETKYYQDVNQYFNDNTNINRLEFLTLLAYCKFFDISFTSWFLEGYC